MIYSFFFGFAPANKTLPGYNIFLEKYIQQKIYPI